jgi:hypothetical protein
MLNSEATTRAPNAAQKPDSAAFAEAVSLPSQQEIRPTDSTSCALSASSGCNPSELLEPIATFPPFPLPWRHPLQSAGWIVRSLFGLASLLVLLAVIAAVPLLNFLALGYLLEVEGRVARSGRLREAFPLLSAAPRLGAVAIGVWCSVLPLRLLAGATIDARIVTPGGAIAERLQVVLGVCWVLVAAHICLALARGGTLLCFARPIKNLRWLVSRLREGDYLQVASSRVQEFLRQLRIQHHFWLGVRGFVAAMIWLFLPTLVFAISDGTTGAQLFGTVIGGLLLVIVLNWVPFLQARFAAENRLAAAFELREVRHLAGYAPFAWLLAVSVVYVLAIPLYLFKAFLLPQDAMWPITLIFIASIYPARVVTGWAYSRALQRRLKSARAHWIARMAARLTAIPLLVAYVVLLHFTQFIGVNGTAGLFEHHAFLLPWAGTPSL